MSITTLIIVLYLFPLEFSGYRNSDLTAPVWYFITETGTIYGFLIIVLMMCVYLWNKKVFRTGKSIAVFFIAVVIFQLLLTAFTQLFLKNYVQRQRPNQQILVNKGMSEKDRTLYFSMPGDKKSEFLQDKINLNREKFEDIYPRTFENWIKDTSYSFPSGHSQLSFFAGTIFSFIILRTASLKKKYLSVIPLIWALLVAVSRVVTGVHFPSDVIAGAFIGMASGLILISIKKFNNIF